MQVPENCPWMSCETNQKTRLSIRDPSVNLMVLVWPCWRWNRIRAFTSRNLWRPRKAASGYLALRPWRSGRVSRQQDT